MSFAAAAQELLNSVKSYPDSDQPNRKKFDIHPSAVLGDREIIGHPEFTEKLVDGTGTETGRFWRSDGQRFGWTGEEFLRMRRLAERIATNKELRGSVSEPFILDLLFMWLCQTSEGKRKDSVGEFISQRCDQEIVDNEIWVPLFRTFSSIEFAIGDVEFKSISKSLLDRWFANRPQDGPDVEERFTRFENETRAKFQATLAACVKVRAEKRAAAEHALAKTLTATALLRFLSPVNWTSKIKSFTLPLGMEKSAKWNSFHLRDGIIVQLDGEAIYQGPPGWVIDDQMAELKGLLDGLSDLAGSQKTQFRQDLFDAMMIYSRNSTTTEPADKLVFVLVALESIFLKDSGEPIQGNLAERMALLIGSSLEERKAIVATVKDTYSLRSKFIHHGQSISDSATLDNFLLYAWSSFVKLIQIQDDFATRVELLGKLDDLKLA